MEAHLSKNQQKQKSNNNLKGSNFIRTPKSQRAKSTYIGYTRARKGLQKMKDQEEQIINYYFIYADNN
jgi:hypothetical protein